MDVSEFYRRSAAIVEELAPSIDPVYRRIVMRAGSAGEWAHAIPELVGALAREGVVITSEQKETLRQLMVFRSERLDSFEQIRTSG